MFVFMICSGNIKTKILEIFENYFCNKFVRKPILKDNRKEIHQKLIQIKIF